MRTYTRKRPEHQLIEGVNELCRLCLTKAEDTIPIFTDNLGNICASLALRIMICVGLEVTQEECLPNIICSACHTELQKYYAFRKKCEVSYQKLKSHLLAVQMKEYKEEIDAIQKQNGEKCEIKEADVKANVEKPDNSIVFMVNMDGTLRLCNETNLNKEQSSIITRGNADPVKSRKSFSQSNIPIIETINRLAQNNEKVVESNSSVTGSSNSIIKSNESLIKSNNLTPLSNKFTNQSNKMIYYNNQLINQINKKVVQSNNTIEKVIENSKTEKNKTCGKSNDEIIKNNDVQMQVEQAEPGPDLSKFLSTVLIELGVLAQNQNDSLVVVDNETRILELETGDGSQVSLQLMEEDDDVENPSSTQLEITVEKSGDAKVPIDGQHTLKGKWADGIEDVDSKDGKSGVRARCSYCGRGFSSRSAAARHARARHARARPHACSHCGRTFAQKEVCARHELVHQESRPFACALCPKSFTQRGALEAHARAHAPPHARALQLYRCARCPKVFLYSSGLSRHMMVHNGRVYTCAGCQRTFRDKSSLKRHLRNTNHAPPDAPLC